MSIACFLLVAAFIGTLVSAMGRCPLWIPVLLLCIATLLACLPLR